MEDNLKHQEDTIQNKPIEPIENQENSQQNNESSNLNNDERDREDQNESQNEKEQNKETSNDLNNSTNKEKEKENMNSTSNNEKGKRHRRGKNETSGERNYKCPDCDKCYLSGPALVIHRKTKHGYNTETEKKSRGRPKKAEQQENSYHNAQIKYNTFLNDERRKKKPDEGDEKEINLDLIKDNLNNIFRQCKNYIFSNINDVEDYPFYQLVIDNWDKNNYEFPSQCLSDNTNKSDSDQTGNKYNSPPLDPIFFMYLKEFSTKTNNNYFWFINKFIVLFRECINSLKKQNVKEEFKKGNQTEYSQLFSAEAIPESCNDFFLEFMQPKNYFGLDENELIELTQNFCFWLYKKQYTHSYLTLLDNK